MKVLFVTRKYPPSVGGMENVARDLYEALRPLASVRLVAYGGKNLYLPFIYPWLLVRSLIRGLRDRPDIVYVQDGVMAPLGLLLKFLLRRPVVVTIHGKEVTYKNGLYRRLVLPALARLDHAVTISEHTAETLHDLLPKLPASIITWGVHDEQYLTKPRAHTRREAVKLMGREPRQLVHSSLLLTSGRLVRRKGVKWFIESALPELVEQSPNVVYVVVGDGEDAQAIKDAVAAAKLQSHVVLLGYVSDKERNVLFNAADLFVMPNIAVPGDMEGFGVVALEASSCGTPVIAAGLEGIKNAVVPGKTGFLLPPGDSNAFVAKIAAELKQPSLPRNGVRSYTLARYNWEQTAKQYLALFLKVAK